MTKTNRVKIGTSFSPEELESKGLSYFQSLEALKVVREEFEIKDIRLGIRWNQAVDKNGTVDLHYYKPFLDYCLNTDIKLTLNIGPIKTFRWPESHVPAVVLKKLEKIPPNNTEIDLEDDMAAVAIHFSEELLNKLQSRYSAEELGHIVMIQPENEAFNAFGLKKWTMSEEYIQKMIETIWEFFPGKEILLSSSGCTNIKKCLEVAQKYVERIHKFTFGINYYYKTPFNQQSPFISWYDDIWRSRFHGISCAKNKKLADYYGYKVEITEAQLEGWGHRIKGPGQSTIEFERMMKRIERFILPEEGGLVRVWGIENFARDYIFKRLSEEQQNIIRIIKDINLA
ncbi:hypothetical protein JW978_03915 [Candidatus Dojkabacteria bacterium]|nr:hypothetical protein [Candidatus Dojkabacteria bacterium]